MNCEGTMRWLDAYLDGELELTRRLGLEAHLAACFTCKTAAEEAVNFESWLRVNMPVYKTPPELKARIQTSLRREFRSGSNGSLISGAVACRAGIPAFALPLAWVRMAVFDGEARRLE
jgi:anti-sigma factor RsiW